MFSTVYARYGITEGIMTNNCGVQVNCGVISGGWPSWGLGARARGLNVRVIILKSNEWEPCIRRWFPAALILNYDENFIWHPVMGDIDVWMSDTNMPNKLNILVSSASIVIMQRRCRQVPPDEWVRSQISLTHAECGGVTDGSWTLHLYTKAISPAMSTGPTISTSGRNVRTVLDSMTNGRPSAEPPKVASTTQPVTVRLQGSTYHCDGLFPWNERLCFFYCPSIYSPTKWVRRHLSGIEMMRLLDIPDELHSELTSKNRATLSQASALLPLKIVIRVLDSLPLHLLSSTPSKRPCLVEPTSLPTVIVNMDVTKSLESCRDSCTSDTATVVVSNKPLVSSPLDVETIASVEATRNLKATKSDNAPVPEYLWDHEIVSPDDVAYHQKVLALSGLRALILRKWKWNLLREFLSWFRTQHGVRSTPTSTKDWIAC